MPSIADSYAAIGVLSTPFAPPSAASMTDTELMQAQRARRRDRASCWGSGGGPGGRDRPSIASRTRIRRARPAASARAPPNSWSSGSPRPRLRAARSLVRVGRLLETESGCRGRPPIPTARTRSTGHRGSRRSPLRWSRVGFRSSEQTLSAPASDPSNPPPRPPTRASRDGLTSAVDVLLRESPSLTRRTARGSGSCPARRHRRRRTPSARSSCATAGTCTSSAGRRHDAHLRPARPRVRGHRRLGVRRGDLAAAGRSALRRPGRAGARR